MFFVFDFQVMAAMDLDIGIIQAKEMMMIDRVINIETINIMNAEDHVHIHNHIHHRGGSVAQISR